eukprot:TRINITY_DN1900_c0_g1_i1.p1 TRINITY_DN1900_c0_g1~~TRINITY_DN1900_c0_g1_i1.p1  ORF type:complete len:396 (+),score=57.63 TRINITY_DN1900_c0_g1_i1:141-1328(+)
MFLLALNLRTRVKVKLLSIATRYSSGFTDVRSVSRELRAVNNTICVAVKRGDVDTALAAYDKMRSERQPRPNLTTFHFLLTGCSRVGRVQRTYKIFNDMKKFGFAVDERALTALANVAAEANSEPAAIQALSIVEKMQSDGEIVTVVALNALLKAFARLGDAIRARRVFSLITQADVISYSTMMSACVNAEQPEQAFAVFDEMIKADVRPDTLTYHPLLRAARLMNNPAVALDLVEDMKSKNIPVLAQTVALTLECCVKTKSLSRKCAELYHGCKQKDAVLCNTYMRILARWGDFSEVFAVFHSMKPLSISCDTGTFVSLLMACGKDSNKAFQVFAELSAMGIRPSVQVMNALLTACGNNSDAAFRVAELMREHNVKANDVLLRKMSSALAARHR